MIEKTIEEVMLEMIKILEEEDEGDVLGLQSALTSLLHRKKTMDSKDFDYTIKKMYAGMGSLNDVVFSDERDVMKVESNVKFDNLRHTLFELVISRHYK